MTNIEHYFLDNQRLFFFWKGRVALYTILKALGIDQGDEVIIPGFTCVVVANAILYLGAKPIYADIDPDTYTINAATVRPLITRKTKAIIAQNTFGLTPDLKPIIDLGEEHKIYVIEDCAQGLGGFYDDKPCGTIASAGFFSTQWSKPISTGVGGIAFIRDDQLAKRVRPLVEKMPRPTLLEELILESQILLRPLLDIPLFYYPLLKLYRFGTQRLGLSVGSSTGQELTGIKMPKGYQKQMGNIQYKRWKKGLKELPEKLQKRQEVAAFYDQIINEVGETPPFRPEYADHTMLRYAIRVNDKEEFVQRAKRHNIPLGNWFVSPLDPVSGDLSQWGYKSGQCPIAEKACQEVINLFTDQALSQEQLNKLFLLS